MPRSVNVIDLQPGAQRKLAESTATVVFYGGGRGGGKSFGVVLEAAKYIDTPGYGAIIFRRTSPELRGTGSIWADTERIYPHLGGTPIESRLQWKFKSGAEIQLSHLQLEKDKHKWQGRNLAFVAFDETQHFTRTLFEFLLSCLRTTCGVPTRFLLTFNPDPDSWLMDFVRPYLDIHGFPIAEMSGKLRFFGRTKGKFQTFETRADAEAAGCDGVTSYTFIPALVFDNPALVLKDPEYIEKLKVLPPIEREQFLMGCWYARSRAGDMIQSQWCPILAHGLLARRARKQPDDAEIVRWCLACDLAGTPRDGDLVPGCPIPRYAESSRDPDWSRLVLLAQFRDGRVVVWNLWSYRDVPGAIEWEMQRILKLECPRGTVVVAHQDPAQAGIFQRDYFARTLRGIARFETTLPMNPIFAATYTARVAFRGMLLLRDPDVSPWHATFVREIEGYSSDGNSSTGHDDIVSALSTGLLYFASKTHPRIAAALPSLDGPMSGENAIRTSPNFRVNV